MRGVILRSVWLVMWMFLVMCLGIYGMGVSVS